VKRNFWVGRAFRNAVESNNSNFCVSLRQLLRPRSIRLEQSGLKMDTESWNVAEERRVRKLQQIRQLLSIALGPDVDLDQEAKNVIEQWEENVEMEDPPRHPRTPLQQLLREYHEICEDILDIEDEDRPDTE
jgi:hypothetical protein